MINVLQKVVKGRLEPRKTEQEKPDQTFGEARWCWNLAANNLNRNLSQHGQRVRCG
ncbi:MAG TPA: hypothetical protein DCY88_12345 [Cyanobacteria bacterium UBA11372]|nr:hypothetical protein [Cyanobacteria bacterium UBA11372]